MSNRERERESCEVGKLQQLDLEDVVKLLCSVFLFFSFLFPRLMVTEKGTRGIGFFFFLLMVRFLFERT